MFSSKSFQNRKRSFSNSDGRRLSDGELSSQLMRKNHELARENAVLREKCRLLELKMRSLERIDMDVYPEKVERLVDTVKPIYQELEIFKEKVDQFQELIRKGMADVLAAQPAKRTSVAAFCRLSATERELHRQAAGQRLKELANNWELSHTGHLSLANMPVTLDDVSDVFDPDRTETPNQSVPISSIARKTAGGGRSHLMGNSVSGKLTVNEMRSGSSAAGDQLISDAQNNVPQCKQPDTTSSALVETMDELSDMRPQGEEKPQKEAVKRKPAPRKPKPTGAAAPAKPRRKKAVKESTTPAEASEATDKSVHYKVDQAGDTDAVADEVNAGHTLRPRRKGVNYKTMCE